MTRRRPASRPRWWARRGARSTTPTWARVVPLAAVALAVVVALGALAAGPSATAQSDEVARGRSLFLRGCSSCHGVNGKGVAENSGGYGPDLTTSGEAGAYYMLATGRMPLSDPDDQPKHRTPAYDEADIDALVAYVASLGDGPALPRVDAKGDLADGGVVFRTNCQACHSASGQGGALSYGRAAPSLMDADPEVVAAAVRSGPGQMPVFSENEISDRQLENAATYVEYLRKPDDPGGLPLGRLGPVPEGFVAWFVGVTLLLACVAWIGTRNPIRRSRR